MVHPYPSTVSTALYDPPIRQRRLRRSMGARVVVRVALVALVHRFTRVVPANAQDDFATVAPTTRNLIVVACHSTPVLAHLRAGVERAARDPTALLVLSGGPTRTQHGPFSEASRYYSLADAWNLWNVANISSATDTTGSHHSDHPTTPESMLQARTALEEYATDSFQNIVFSIARFYEVTGSFPHHITILSYSYKEWRFVQLHRAALQWPAARFHFVGIDDTDSALVEAIGTVMIPPHEHGAIQLFHRDPYGCTSPVRRTKNPYSRTPPYRVSCPALSRLLQYCGTELLRDEVPWL